jgi:hypothetical protein
MQLMFLGYFFHRLITRLWLHGRFQQSCYWPKHKNTDAWDLHYGFYVFSVTHFVTMFSQWHISSRCFLSDTFRHDVLLNLKFIWSFVTKCVAEKTSWRNVSLRKHRDEMCHCENIVTKCVTEKDIWILLEL